MFRIFKKKSKITDEDIKQVKVEEVDPYTGRGLASYIVLTVDSEGFWKASYKLTQAREKDGIWEERTKEVTFIDKSSDQAVLRSKSFMDNILGTCGYDLFTYYEEHPNELEEYNNGKIDSNEDTKN
jgi:hypothetical protein